MTRARKQFADYVDVRAARLAALWAQRIGLPAGNLWEPGITRYIVKEVERLGGDANAWAHTEAIMRMRLGLPAPEAR